MIWVTPGLILGGSGLILSRIFYKRAKVYKPFAKNVGFLERCRRVGNVLCKDLP